MLCKGLTTLNLNPKQEGHDGPGLLTRVIFPTIVPLLPTCDTQGGASFDSI